MNIGRIQQAVGENEITITELAKELGINRRTWYRWMNKESDPGHSKIVKLCEILGIDINEIEE